MRKSGKVLLSTIFLAAVAAGKAGAQQMQQEQQRDTTDQRHHASHGGGGFLTFLRFRHNREIRRGNIPIAHTTAPRTQTGGFGNSLRTASVHS